MDVAELSSELVELILTREVPENERVKISEASGGTTPEPPADFLARLEDPSWDDVASIWDGLRLPPEDDSRSGWDFWLAIALARHGIKAAEMARILRAFPHGRGSEATGQYLTLTISKALDHERVRAMGEAFKATEAMSDLDHSTKEDHRAKSDTTDEKLQDFRCSCGRWLLLRHKFTAGQKKRIFGRGSRCRGCKRLLRHQRIQRTTGALSRWGEAEHIIITGNNAYEALVKRVRRQREQTGMPHPYFAILHENGVKHVFTAANVGGEPVECSDPKKLEALLVPLIDVIDPGSRRGIDGSQGWEMIPRKVRRKVEWERFAETTKKIEAQDEILHRYGIYANTKGEFNDSHLTEQERIDYIRELVRVAEPLPANSPVEAWEMEEQIAMAAFQ